MPRKKKTYLTGVVEELCLVIAFIWVQCHASSRMTSSSVQAFSDAIFPLKSILHGFCCLDKAIFYRNGYLQYV